jgi:hypothetical protein
VLLGQLHGLPPPLMERRLMPHPDKPNRSALLMARMRPPPARASGGKLSGV